MSDSFDAILAQLRAARDEALEKWNRLDRAIAEMEAAPSVRKQPTRSEDGYQSSESSVASRPPNQGTLADEVLGILNASPDRAFRGREMVEALRHKNIVSQSSNEVNSVRTTMNALAANGFAMKVHRGAYQALAPSSVPHSTAGGEHVVEEPTTYTNGRG